jgi:hypothetical protein
MDERSNGTTGLPSTTRDQTHRSDNAPRTTVGSIEWPCETMRKTLALCASQKRVLGPFLTSRRAADGLSLEPSTVTS